MPPPKSLPSPLSEPSSYLRAIIEMVINTDKEGYFVVRWPMFAFRGWKLRRAVLVNWGCQVWSQLPACYQITK
jgi:hypothetical protein